METEKPDGERAHRARTVPVERLRGGDHSCLISPDGPAKWNELAAHTWTGLLNDEKVMIILDDDDPSDNAAAARIDGGVGRVRAAVDSGQVVFARNTDFNAPDDRFDKQRQLALIAGEIERAGAEGWRGLRSWGDMRWVLRQGVDDGVIVDYEAALAPLFANRNWTAICWYDREVLNDYLVVAARGVHPIHVMDRLDAIEIRTTPTGRRIAGFAGPSARAEFTDVLRAAVERPMDRGPVDFELNLTDLSYMEAHCAAQLVSLAASLPAGSTFTIRCAPLHELALRGLGAATVPQLRILVEEEQVDERI